MGISKLNDILTRNKGLLFNEAVCAADKDGEILYRYAVDCDEDAVFDLASISKLLTTTMLLRLATEAKLRLDDSLALVFEGSAPMGKTAKRRLRTVTLRSAMLHASGLPAWYPFYTGGEFWQTLEHVLEREPEVKGVLYSDINFILLGKAVELLSGAGLLSNLDSLNRALGTEFTYNPKDRAACVPTEFGNRCEMKMCAQRGLSFMPSPGRGGWRDTSVQIRGEANDGNCWYAFGGVSGHAGVFGRAEDLLRLGAVYLNGGAAGAVQLISRSLAEEALRDAGAGRGLGFDTSDMFPHGAGHTGFTGTALYLCRERGLCAALLASRLPLPGPPDLGGLRRTVFGLMHDAAV